MKVRAKILYAIVFTFNYAFLSGPTMSQDICQSSNPDAANCFLEEIREDPGRRWFSESRLGYPYWNWTPTEGDGSLDVLLEVVSQLTPKEREMSDLQIRYLFQNIGLGCNGPLFLRARQAFSELGLSDENDSVFFFYGFAGCKENYTPNYEVIQNEIDDQTDQSLKNKVNGFLIDHYTSSLQLDQAIAQVHRLFEDFDPEEDAFLGLDVRYHRVAGQQVATLADALIGADRIEDARDLIDFYLGFYSYGRHEKYYLFEFGKRRLSSRDGNNYLQLAEYYPDSEMKGYAYSGAAIAFLRSGQVEDAYELVLDAGRMSLYDSNIRDALLAYGLDEEAEQVMSLLDIQLPRDLPEPATILANRLQSLVRQSKWEELDGVIDTLPDSKETLEAIRHVAFHTLLNVDFSGEGENTGHLKNGAGPSLATTERSLRYFEKSMPLVEDEGGHILYLRGVGAPAIVFDNQFRQNPEILEIVELLEQSGLFRNGSLNGFRSNAEIEFSFMNDDLQSFQTGIELAFEQTEHDFVRQSVVRRYCETRVMIDVVTVIRPSSDYCNVARDVYSRH